MSQHNHPDRWQEVERVLDALIELEPDERAACFAELDVDEGVRREVAALLEADAQAPTFLDADAADFAVPLLPDSPEVEPAADGRRVGAYRLVREIGRGGMSTVYLAERDDGQFDRQVALKIIRQDHRREDLRQRFRAERQILASLDHPHVASVYDGGLTDDGLPYLVMEYVDGTPIVQYCDRERLTIKQRVRLFIDVCTAVRHAHRNLVVHRDLKPSNVLVSRNGTVKLLDFGIAKLLDEDLDYTVPVTVTGERWMTPAYAAPEQIRGGAVTTATDVYGLGALLYELLAGCRPFDGAGTAPHQVAAAVLETEPTRPSGALARSGEAQPGTLKEVAEARRVPPKRLRRLLAGDLDAVVLKALRKEPEARYASAEALTDDLEAYLDQRPVAARRGAWAYRARKYAQRHRWRLAAAAVLLVAVVGAAVGHTLRVTAERDRARDEADKAEAVTQFLVQLVEASDPAEAPGDTGTARELLARGVARAQALGAQPATQAQLLDAMGRMYQALGRFDQADSLLHRALAVRRSVYGDERDEVAESLLHLAALHDARSEHDRAVARTREALQVLQALHGSTHERVAVATNRLANMLLAREPEQAEPLYRTALRLYRQHQGEASTRVALVLGNLGLALREQGRFEEAVTHLREALEIHRALHDEPHLDLAITTRNLGLTVQQLGRYEEAANLLEEHVALRRHLHGPVHGEVAAALAWLGTLLVDMGQLERAEETKREALQIVRAVYGEEHPYTAFALNNLASLLIQRGAFGEAEQLLQASLEVRRKLYGPRHTRVATALNNLARVQQRQGRFEAAEASFRASLELRRENHGDDHPRVARVLTNLGRLYREQGAGERALPLLREALGIFRGSSEAPIEMTETLTELGSSLMSLDRLDEARPLLEEAVAVLRETDAWETVRAARTQLALGTCLFRQRSYAQAEPLLLASYQTLRSGDEEATLRRAARRLTELYEARQMTAEASRYRQVAGRLEGDA